MPPTCLTTFFQHDTAEAPLAPPRCLAAFWRHHPLADQAGETLVAATLAFQRTTGVQLVKLTPAGNYQVAGRGGHAEWRGDAMGRRTFLRRAITRPSDWLNLSASLTPLERDMVAAAQCLRQALPAEVPLLATVFPPLTQALMLAGPEQLRAQVQSAPDAVSSGLATLQTGTGRLLAAYQAAGVDGIYLAAQHLSEAVLPRGLYRHIGRAGDLATMAACDGFSGNILHIHGPNIHFDGLPSNGQWLIHYELGAANPPASAYRAISHLPAVIGLPFTVWDTPGRLHPAIHKHLAGFQQTGALLTGPCVIPLAITDAHIATWIRTINHGA